MDGQSVSDEVRYWRFRRTEELELLRKQYVDTDSEGHAEDEDDEDYEILYPASDELAVSQFYRNWMPKLSLFEELSQESGQLELVPLFKRVCAALVRRFSSGLEENWSHHTFRSFLEVYVWISCVWWYASTHQARLSAILFGTAVAFLISFGNELLSAALRMLMTLKPGSPESQSRKYLRQLFCDSFARDKISGEGSREILESNDGKAIPRSADSADCSCRRWKMIHFMLLSFISMKAVNLALLATGNDLGTAVLVTGVALSLSSFGELSAHLLVVGRPLTRLQLRWQRPRRSWIQRPWSRLVELLFWVGSLYALILHESSALSSLVLATHLYCCFCLAMDYATKSSTDEVLSTGPQSKEDPHPGSILPIDSLVFPFARIVVLVQDGYMWCLKVVKMLNL